LADITVQQLGELQSIPVATPLDEIDLEALTDRLERSVEEEVDQRDTRDGIRSVLWSLPQRERVVLEERYGINGEPRTLDDIGREMSLTRERIRQIETQALKKLRLLDTIHAFAPVRTPAAEASDEAAPRTMTRTKEPS
jgi:RNA polymerase sigma factor (sigma-70 family)